MKNILSVTFATESTIHFFFFFFVVQIYDVGVLVGFLKSEKSNQYIEMNSLFENYNQKTININKMANKIHLNIHKKGNKYQSFV